eukprot:c52326_g1_i1.p1 GENE.c52326_g1_i1~~c52326_g1_i1.p1  ORF type:complete len:151 (+),score=36.95 c52326_g1_i1:43-453(+)
MKAALFVGLVALAMAMVLAMAMAEGGKPQLRIGVLSRPESCDRKSKKGDRLSMHYTGTLESGDKFDSSLDRNEPFQFQLGSGQVIKGWDQGLNGMCVGEKRRLRIPSHLGYGEHGSPPKIPGGATLVFEVELLAIE